MINNKSPFVASSWSHTYLLNFKNSGSFHVTITLLAWTTCNSQVYNSKNANDSLQYVTVICKLGVE